MTVSLLAFLEQVGSPAGAAEFSVMAGRPAVVVDLTQRLAPIDTERAGRVIGGLPTVMVGVTDGRLGGAGAQVSKLVDVVVADPAPVLQAVNRNPLASVTLAFILRGTLQLDTNAALAAESAAYSLLQGGPEFARWRAGQVARPPTEDSGPVVDLRRDGATLGITLCRPARHNALNTAMRDQLYEALIVAGSDPSIVRVIIDGAGPSFCSGGDLDEFGSFPDPATSHLTRLSRSAGRLISAMADKVEARLHGACMGAGIELPAFASRVVADRETVFALPEVGLGLIPGAGGTVSLPRRIGRQRMCELALTQARIGAATALDWGLIDEISPRGPPLSR